MNTPRRARAFAPATIANVGPGYDAIGLALRSPGDFATAERTDGGGLLFRMSRPDPVLGRPEKNVAARVARLLLDEMKPPFGVTLTLDKRMPIGSGLGSSAASGVAALTAVNAILPKPLPKEALLRFAVEGERIASGSPHADNAAPCLLGGIRLILGTDPLEVRELPFVNRFTWVVVHPHLVVETKTARRLLPRTLPLRIAVGQWAHAAGLAAGLASGDLDLVGRALVDAVAEPVRAPLIEGFADVKAAALRAGAAGCSLSGSGPSLFAVTGSRAAAERVGRAMKNAFRAHGVDADVILSAVNRRGARVVARS